MLRNLGNVRPRREFPNKHFARSWTFLFVCMSLIYGSVLPLKASEGGLAEDGRAWLNYMWFTRVEGKRPYMQMLKEAMGPEDLCRIRELATEEAKAMMDRAREGQNLSLKTEGLLKEIHEDLPKRLWPLLEKVKEKAKDDWQRMRKQSRSASFKDLTLVYATQYYGETDTEAALPDRFIKFANRGWQLHAGYEKAPYFVFLRLQGESRNLTGVIVWDVGPWNEDDNYWEDPHRRRAFPGLPRGLPEAEAAFFDDYNDGKDQFGRQVLNPAGIDLTPKAAGLLGLEPLENAWVEIDMGSLP